MFHRRVHRATTLPLILTVIALAAILIPHLVRAADDRPSRAPIIGTVKSVEDGGRVIVVRVGSKNYRVSGVDRCSKQSHRVTKLGDVKSGTTVQMLCRYQKAVNGPGAGQDLDPQFIQVAAIVVGPFSPPPISKGQKKVKVEWRTGFLLVDDNRNRFSLEGTNIQVGQAKPVIVVTPDSPQSPVAVEKGMRVRILGKPIEAPEVEDKKEQRRLARMIHLEATLLERLAKKAPKKEYAAVLGLAP